MAVRTRIRTDAEALHLDSDLKEVIVALCHALGLLP